MLTFTIVMPGLAIFLYTVIFEILLALIGGLFLYLYSTGHLPFFKITPHDDTRPILYLILGVSFLIGVAVSSTLLCMQLSKFKQV